MPAGSQVASAEEATDKKQTPEEQGLEAIEDAATAPRGEDGKPEIAPGTERGALAFLLSPPQRHEYKAPVKIETDTGQVDLSFVLTSLAGRQLRDIERRYSKDGTLGPLAEIDEQAVAAATVAAALVRIEDPVSGQSLNPRDPQFMVNARGERIVDPAAALEARFEFQSGILTSLASEVRRISGYGPDRVGSAQRVMVDAVGHSSNGVD